MKAMSININSFSQFRKILDTSQIVVADFYADWCGPCKAIAPTFESLAAKYSKPNRITFTKINVDSQHDISASYGVKAMPTFMIFKSGKVTSTVRGADASGLRNSIELAIKLAGPMGPVYSSKGRTLGSITSQDVRPSKPFDIRIFLNTVLRFIALYFTTLISLDAYGAGENSSFNINKMPTNPTTSSVVKQTRITTSGKKLGTIADL